MKKRRMLGFLASVLVLALVAGTWAYYTSTNAIDNPMATKQYGVTTNEKFTPNTDWKPGQETTKEVGVKNTGDYPLVVRVKMEEEWTLADGSKVKIDSTNAEFNPAAAATSGYQDDWDTADSLDGTEDGLVKDAGGTNFDGSVVFKTLEDGTKWTKGTDGYWYYKTQLAKDTTTENLMEKITLCADTDMGHTVKTNYYTTSDTVKDEAPSATNISANPTDHASKWIQYTTTYPTDIGTVYLRSVSGLGAAGYSGADYVLTITSEVCQATKVAVDAEWGGGAAFTAPAGTSWSLPNN